MTARNPKPWERQVGETDRAYKMFCLYRDQKVAPGEGRQIRKVAEEIGRYLSHCRRQSMRWHWRARAEAYDDHIEKEFLDKEIKLRVKARLRAAKVGRMLSEKAVTKLEQMDIEKEVTAQVAERMAKTGIEMELNALGEPSSRSAFSGEVKGPIEIVQSDWESTLPPEKDEKETG